MSATAATETIADEGGEVRLLTDELRGATRTMHQAAESSTFMADLVAGELDRAAYCALLVQYREIYAALEAAEPFLADDPIGRVMVVPGLARSSAIEADLRGLLGEGGAATALVVPATLAYVERLRWIVRTRWVGGYVAHAYTRYLGDLAGGQVIRQVAQRRYGVDPDHLAFSTFSEAPNVKTLRDEYRGRLNSLPLSESERAAVAAEACVAFTLNTAVFDGLARAADPSR